MNARFASSPGNALSRGCLKATLLLALTLALTASLVLLVSWSGTATSEGQTPAPYLKWGSYGSEDGQFNNPYGIAVNATGNVYVADTYNNRIQKFSSSGAFLAKWGSYGTGDGQFRSPYGIAVDASGNVYVTDTNNSRIQKFSGSGTFLAKWGSYGTGEGQFRSPYGIAVGASDHVYVADTGNHRIQVFSLSGDSVGALGGQGAGDLEFYNPYGVAASALGDVYVADTSNKRIQRISSPEGFTKWGSYGTADGQFARPFGLEVDASGNVYVADTLNYRIEKFDASGAFLGSLGSRGTADGQIDYAFDIATDAAGSLFVADTFNNRIQRFGPSGPPPTPVPPTPAPTPVGSPAVGRIAFTSHRVSPYPGIYIMNADGSDQVPLVSSTTTNNFDPDVSRDGTKIVFVSTRDQNQELYVMYADGSVQTRLTNSGSSESDPAWSWDGTKIAFASMGASLSNDIYVMDADGSDVSRLTVNGGSQPTWSPDGTRIAFVSRRDSTPTVVVSNIYVIDVDGSNETRITNELPGSLGGLSWSPDGSRIVYGSATPYNQIIGVPDYESRGLFIINADGSNRTALPTDGPLGLAGGSAWAPDGSRIAFNTGRHQPIEIYTVYTDGTGLVKLTNTDLTPGVSAGNVGPSWSISGTATPGPLHHIVGGPLDSSIAAGRTRTFSAAGFDQDNNPIGGLSFLWSVTNPLAGSINASTGVFTAGTTLGTYADAIQVSTGGMTASASVTITVGPLDHITVSPSNPVMQLGESQTFTAQGYDQANIPRTGDVFTWSVSTANAGSIDASTGVFTAGTVPGTYFNVIGAYSGGMTGRTSVTVLAGPLHHITVSPSNQSVQVGSARTFSASSYDQNNYLRSGDTFVWSVSNPAAGFIDASTGVFTAGTTPSTYSDVIRATSGAVTGTASVTIMPGPLHHIVVSPSSPSVEAGGTQVFSATGYDQYNNPRSGDNFTWSVSNPAVGSINWTTGAFTAGTVAGVYSNVLQVRSGTVTATTSVTVTSGPTHHITVSPANLSVAVNGSQAFSAAGFDQFNNPITGLSFTWSVSNSKAGSINASSGGFAAGTTAGAYSIQATANAVSGTTSVTVTPGPLNHITVRPSNPYVPVNGAHAYSATGYDQYSNAISGLTFAWSLTDGSAGSIDASTGILTAGSAAGAFPDVVQVVSGEVSATTSVRVVDGNVLNGSVTLQGGSRTAAARVVSVTVKLFSPGASTGDLTIGTGALATFDPTTEDIGNPTVFFQVIGEGLAPGAYDVTVIGPCTLMNVKRNVVIETGATSVNLGTLLEGNSNNDGIINAIDFSILAATYLKSTGQAGFDSRADYDYSGMVNAVDFSLMAANYLKTSPQNVS